MKNFSLLISRAAVFCAIVPLFIVPATTQADDKEKGSKTKKVEVKDITLKVPEAWKQEEPSSNLRLATFKISAVKGEKEDAELAIYSFGGGGGGVEQNIARWVGEFAAEGREANVMTGKSSQGEYIIADIEGTHLGPGFRRRPAPLGNARMLSVVLAVEKKGNYFLKLTGPSKTVSKAADEFRASFGGDEKKEKEYSK